MYFRFCPSKTKWIGIVLTNRQTRRITCSVSCFWSTFVCCVIRRFRTVCLLLSALLYWHNDASRAIRQYATILQRLQFPVSISRPFFSVRRALPINAEWLVASIGNAQYKGGKKNIDLLAAFRLFGTPLPIHFTLLGRKRKYIKSKTTARLIEKRTSIAAVRDKLGQFDTFPTPLLSRGRLPKKGKKGFLE